MFGDSVIDRALMWTREFSNLKHCLRQCSCMYLLDILCYSLDEQRVQEGGGAMDMTPSSVSSVSEMEELLSNIDIADRVVSSAVVPKQYSARGWQNIQRHSMI